MFQNHPKMNVIEHWTIQTINEEMDIPSVNDYVTHANENNGSTPHIRAPNPPPSRISRQERSTFI